MLRLLTAAGVVLLLSLTACAGGPMTDSTPPASDPPPFLTSSPGPITPPGTPPGTPTEVPQAHWDAIVADLGARGVTGTPQLVSAQSVTWNSGALGCPKPGMSYTQAMVDGWQVIVSVDGRQYDYRFGTTDRPVLCEQ